MKIFKYFFYFILYYIYGEEFGEMYNSLNGGVPIGGFLETVTFIDMVEVAKKMHKRKNKQISAQL